MKQVLGLASFEEIIFITLIKSTKMSPLEILLFLTFLTFSYYYKFALFVIYFSLVFSYAVFSVKKAPQGDGFDVTKQKLLTSTFSSPDEGCADLFYEFDVTESMKYAARLSKENDFPVTITHIALRAIALGLSKTKDVQGVFKWGNFESHDDVHVTTVVNVDGGKDLVPIHIRNPDIVGVLQIAKRTNAMVQKARKKEDQVHKKRYAMLPYLPTFLIRLMTTLSAYLINQLNMKNEAGGIHGRDFGNALVSNIGVFGVKRAFPPLIELSGCSLLIAMGKVQKRAVVRDNKITIRSMMNFNFAFDCRYGPLECLKPCYEILKQYFQNPQSFENI